MRRGIVCVRQNADFKGKFRSWRVAAMISGTIKPAVNVFKSVESRAIINSYFMSLYIVCWLLPSRAGNAVRRSRAAFVISVKFKAAVY
jgi:hypothetical protein